MKRILFTVVLGLFCASSWAAKIDTLYISTAYTTHIIFPTDLTYADLSNNKAVAAKIIEQNRNMLALKAREPFENSCSVSALESNGSMHTFIIVYADHPDELVIDLRRQAGQGQGQTYASPTARMIAEQKELRSGGQSSSAPRGSAAPRQGRRLPGSPANGGAAGSGDAGGSNVSTWKTGSAPLLSEVIEQPQHIYHVGCKEYDIQVLCEDISSFSDITYMTISLKNDSGISYDISDATFVIESKKAGKRTVKYDKTVFPRSRYGKLAAGPGEYTRIAYSFDKMTLSKDQVLKVYLYESGGQRNLVMTIDTKDINKARTNI